MNTIATNAGLTPAQQSLNDLWDEHVRDEFATKDAAAAPRYDGARRLREPRPSVDRRRGARPVDGILFEALHSKHAVRYGNRTNFSNNWLRPALV